MSEDNPDSVINKLRNIKRGKNTGIAAGPALAQVSETLPSGNCKTRENFRRIISQ